MEIKRTKNWLEMSDKVIGSIYGFRATRTASPAVSMYIEIYTPHMSVKDARWIARSLLKAADFAATK
jgi:hypothetical protein